MSEAMTPREFLIKAIIPAAAILPAQMDSRRARLLVLAICLQESNLQSRYQIVQGKPGAKGPARGFPQFEKGSKLFGGGIWGVYKHKASKFWLAELCKARGCEFHPDAIHIAIETDDVLAAGLARLLLFTEATPLPAEGDHEAAWIYYAKKTWRPGRPHPEKWLTNYRKAQQAIGI